MLDTWVGTTNQGNRVIMEAVLAEVRALFPDDFLYQVSAYEYVRAGRALLRAADHVFLGGTNVLSANMNRTSEWRLRPVDLLWLRNVTLLGVGWWQYQPRPVNRYTRFLLRHVLRPGVLHSVRDSYTRERLAGLSIPSLNTGCPSLWRLDPAHCARIPQRKGSQALLTFSEYNQDEAADRELFAVVRRSYRKVRFWSQQYGDYPYARRIGDGSLEFVAPSLEALDEALGGEGVDVVGTRLHAGIRALQHGRRAIVVGIDNRALEMARDVRLPVVARERVNADLEQLINGCWATELRVDAAAIAAWKRQLSP